MSTLPTGALRLGLLAAAALASAAPGALAQTYKIDSGQPGPALGYAFPEDYCWLNRLQIPGTETITSIEAILGDAPNGAAVTFCIWKDLGGYGQPWDGLLLASQTSLVKNGSQQLLTQYPIPPTTVSGSIFVGAYMTVNASLSPATYDPHVPTAGRSWIATAYGPGTFDPTWLGAWTWYALPTIGPQGVFMLRANGADGPTPEARCTAKTNSAGCVPALSFQGTCSASAGSGFTIRADQVLNRQPGLFVYSRAGLQQVPFGGGSLCLRPPFRRTPLMSSGGSATGVDCTGSYAFDFNAWIAGGPDHFQPGETIDGQFWSRDPGFAAPDSIGLTQAAHFGIAP